MMTKKSGRIMILSPMTSAKLAEQPTSLFAGDPDVTVVALREGPNIINSRMEQVLAGPDSVRIVKEAEATGYQAIILACHGDPNLYHLREAVSIPVLGPMQIGMHFCSVLAGKFSIISSPGLYVKISKEDLINRYGFERKIASLRTAPFKQPIEQVAELSRRKPIPKEVIGPAVEECIKAIVEDGATAITFGCGVLMSMADELKIHLRDHGFDVPVINPLPLAVDVARLLIRQGLSHSKLAYPLPTKA
jgi:allantoin racemase